LPSLGVQILLKAVIKHNNPNPSRGNEGVRVGELELKTKIVERVIPIFSA
jgi:hypothetical protein